MKNYIKEEYQTEEGGILKIIGRAIDRAVSVNDNTITKIDSGFDWSYMGDRPKNFAKGLLSEVLLPMDMYGEYSLKNLTDVLAQTFIAILPNGPFAVKFDMKDWLDIITGQVLLGVAINPYAFIKVNVSFNASEPIWVTRYLILNEMGKRGEFATNTLEYDEYLNMTQKEREAFGNYCRLHTTRQALDENNNVIQGETECVTIEFYDGMGLYYSNGLDKKNPIKTINLIGESYAGRKF